MTCLRSSSQRRPREVIVEFANRILPTDMCETIYSETELPAVEFLPQRFVFESGIAVVVRSARKDEDRILYDIMRSAADAGIGYGVDEFPTFDYFRLKVLLEHVCIVFEDELNGKVTILQDRSCRGTYFKC
jgi:hypothetical protein